MIREPEVYSVVVIDDDKGIMAESGIFGGLSEFTCEGKRFQCRHLASPSEAVDGLTYLDLMADVVLLDINFEGASREDLKGIQGPNEKAGLEILRSLKRIDPLIPVLMLSSIDEPDIVFESGSANADAYLPKVQLRRETQQARERGDIELTGLGRQIRQAWLRCAEHPMYDPDHLTIANRFAGDYDISEQEKVATVAYYHYENELIIRALTELSESAHDNSPVEVLDLGCGTGRIEHLIAASPHLLERVHVTAIDFSANMLREFRAGPPQLPHLTVLRGPIEAFCTYQTELAPNTFDLIIAGFGFFSYVNYKIALPAFKKRLGRFSGVASFLKPGGKMLVSVYNENSLNYDVIAKRQLPNEDRAIAAVMDKSSGVLAVDDYEIACDSFEPSRLIRLLRQTGLAVAPEDVSTFPTVHLTLNNRECQSSAQPGFVRGGDPLFTHGLFNEALYCQDLAFSQSCSGRGHYVVATARRPSADEVNKEDS